MGYSYDDLREIFEKTNGKCKQCGKQLSLDNYDKWNGHGSWVVDDNVPKSKDDTVDNPRNLWPLCYLCNFYKREEWLYDSDDS